MLTIAVVLAVATAMVLFMAGTTAMNIFDKESKEASYAAVLGMAIVIMGSCAIAMFKLLFPN